MARGLTQRHQRFADELLLDGNVTQAAIRAGYSRRSAPSTGARVARTPEVAEYLAAKRAEIADRMRLRQEDVIQELKRIAFSDPRRAVDANGLPIPLHQLPEDIAHALAGSEVELVMDPARRTDDGLEIPARARASVRKWKWWDKPKALELAMRYLGMLNREDPGERVQVQVNINMGGE